MKNFRIGDKVKSVNSVGNRFIKDAIGTVIEILKNSVSVDIYTKPSEYTYKTRSETLDTIKAEGDKVISDTEGKYSSKVLFKGEYFRLKTAKDGYEAKSYLQK